MEIDGKNYNFKEAKTEINFDDLGLHDSKLKSIFDRFDLNKDGKLSSEEQKHAFSIFTGFDNTNGVADSNLSDDEIKEGLLSLPKEIRISVEAMKDFIIKLNNLAQGKSVASNIKDRIHEMSFSNTATIASLNEIDSNNVLEVIEEYKNLAPKKSLASAVDDELGLNIDDVKKYICKQLVTRAKEAGIKDAYYSQYMEIDNIKKLNKFIDVTVEKIKAKEAENIQNNFAKPIPKTKAEICEAAYEKWRGKNAFKNSPLKIDFFEKLYDVMELLNVKQLNPSRSDGKVEKSANINNETDKEKLFDQFVAIFAGEAQLNPKSVFHGKINYYGLFQVDAPTLKGIIKWSRKHPDVPGMQNIDAKMTVNKFIKLTGVQQLDYLIAYIGSSKEGSHISEEEEMSPAKIWSMIKLPNLPEDNPDKLARRNKTIQQKVNATDSIVGKYCQ